MKALVGLLHDCENFADGSFAALLATLVHVSPGQGLGLPPLCLRRVATNCLHFHQHTAHHNHHNQAQTFIRILHSWYRTATYNPMFSIPNLLVLNNGSIFIHAADDDKSSKLGRNTTACYHATTSLYPLLSYVLLIESLVTIVTTPGLIKSYLPGLKPGRVTSD